MINEINIEKLILHILDPSIGLPVLSEEEHPHSGETIEFIKTHIEKIFKDINVKQSFFSDDNNQVKILCEDIKSNNDLFIERTKDLSQMMYDLLTQNVDIPPYDLICSLFKGDDKTYLGFFIFNYKTSYIHYVEELETGRLNTVIKQNTTLANLNQKIDQFFIIDLEDFSILLKEKKYEINGEKDYYLSKHLLNSIDSLSNKAKVDIVNRVSKKIVKDYYDDDVAKLAEIKSTMVESIEETNSIDVDFIKTKVFKNNLDIQKIYEEEIDNKGLKDKFIAVNENLSKRIAKTQKLTMDNGIEIKVPIEYLAGDEMIEFLNNSDGTISVLLKNIKGIKGK